MAKLAFTTTYEEANEKTAKGWHDVGIDFCEVCLQKGSMTKATVVTTRFYEGDYGMDRRLRCETHKDVFCWEDLK